MRRIGRGVLGDGQGVGLDNKGKLESARLGKMWNERGMLCKNGGAKDTKYGEGCPNCIRYSNDSILISLSARLSCTTSAGSTTAFEAACISGGGRRCLSASRVLRSA